MKSDLTQLPVSLNQDCFCSAWSTYRIQNKTPIEFDVAKLLKDLECHSLITSFVIFGTKCKHCR